MVQIAIKTIEEYIEEYISLDEQNESTLERFWTRLNQDIQSKNPYEKQAFMKEFIESVQKTLQQVGQKKGELLFQ